MYEQEEQRPISTSEREERKLSLCRNCFCLHYWADDLEAYPSHCYCPEEFRGHLRCKRYIPSDNLQYLEWCLKNVERGYCYEQR
jgi:hypothetical protein